MTCNLTLETFNGKIAGDSFLDNDWKCRTCQLTAGAHPLAQAQFILPCNSTLLYILDVKVKS